MESAKPKRGEVWMVDFSPSIGREIQNLHPALVVSANELNKSTWGLIVVCPITTSRKRKPFRLHVEIKPPDGGLKNLSIIRCDQIKSVSIERFSKSAGSVQKATIEKVDMIVRKVLSL